MPDNRIKVQTSTQSKVPVPEALCKGVNPIRAKFISGTPTTDGINTLHHPR